MRVVFTPEAERQADEMESWWRRHRPKAPGLFAGELAEGCRLIATMPTLGATYETKSGSVVRRVLMPKTRTHVYFNVDEERDVVIVLAVWGAPRRRGPRL